MKLRCTPLFRYPPWQFATLCHISIRSATFCYTFSCHCFAHLHFAPLYHICHTPLHSAILHYSPLQFSHCAFFPACRSMVTLRETGFALLHSVLHYALLRPRPKTLRYASLPFATLRYALLHPDTLRRTPSHHCTPLHSLTLPYTPLHSLTLPYTPLHSVITRNIPNRPTGHRCQHLLTSAIRPC